jgi:hypothetical protein
LVAFPDERVEVAERKNFYPGSRKNLKKVEGVRSKEHGVEHPLRKAQEC